MLTFGTLLASSALSDWLDSPVIVVWCSIVSSSLRIGPSPGLFVTDSGPEVSFNIDWDGLRGLQGRLRIGVAEGSGRSTVKPRLKGQAVTSYCSSLARTSFNDSAFSCSSALPVGSSIR